MAATLRRTRRRNARTAFADPAPLVYLLRDRFLIDDAAPLTTPRPCEPGPGQLTIAGTTAAVAGQLFTLDVGAASEGPYDPTSRPRSAGLAIIASKLRISRLTSLVELGWTASAGMGASSMQPGLRFAGAPNGLNAINGANLQLIENLALDTDYDVAVVLDTDGGFLLWRATGSQPWKLAAIVRVNTTSPVFSRQRWFNAAATVKGYDVIANFPLPQRVNGLQSGAVGTLSLPSGDFTGRLRITDTADGGLIFREQTPGQDYFLAERTAAGALRLRRFDGGSPTTVATTAITTAVNDALMLKLDGNTFRVNAQKSDGSFVSLAEQTITQYATARNVKPLAANFDQLELYERNQLLAA